MSSFQHGARHAGLARVPGLFLTMVLLFSAIVIAHPASAETLSWSVVNTPGAVGDQLLAGSDVDFLVIASDGMTMFAYDNTNHQLYKSTDAGFTWTTSGIGGVLEGNTLVAMAISPDYSEDGTVVAATGNKVFRSINGGQTFTDMGINVSGLLAAGSAITSIAISPWYKGGLAIMAGDSDGAQNGGISVFNTVDLAWVDLKVGDWNGDGVVEDPCDALAVAFSPQHMTDFAMMAVVTYDVAGTVNTKVTSKVGDRKWASDVVNGTIFAEEAATAVIAFPDGYSWGWENRFLVGTTGTNSDDAFRVTPDLVDETTYVGALDVNGSSIETDVISIAIRGEVYYSHTALVGVAGSATIRYSSDVSDSTIHWKSGGEPLPGSAGVKVLWSPTDDIAYAINSGAGSALSRSADYGNTWSQIALIDVSALTNVAVIDFAVAEVSTFYLLMWDDADNSGAFSADDYTMLFRTTDSGLKWEQIAFHWSVGADAMNILALSPNYTTDETLFVAQTDKIIWRTADGGHTFTKYTAPQDITAISVVDSTTYYTGHADAFYKSNRSDVATLGGDAAVSIKVVSGAIFVGTDDGMALVSTDDGKTFMSLGEAKALGSGAKVYVEVDPDYASNKIVYAGSSSVSIGVRSWVLNSSTAWKPLDNDSSTLSCVGLGVTDYGAFYAASNAVITEPVNESHGGVRRSVSQTAQRLYGNFESMTDGLSAGARVEDLKVASDSNLLYAIVSNVATGSFGYPYRLVVFEDTMAVAPQLISPEDKSVVSGTVVLTWQPIESPVSTKYRYQVATDTSFANYTGGTSDGSMASIAGLDAGSEYWWRVFVEPGEPLRSKESAVWSFTLQLPAPVLRAPLPGERRIQLRPMFAWDPVDGAASYELEFADNPEYKNATIQKALTHTVWTWEEDLAYSTNYFWRVRAIKGDGSGTTASPWSESVFTTMAALLFKPVPRVEVKEAEPPQAETITLPAPAIDIPPGPPPKQIAPLYIWVIVALVFLLFIAIIILIITTSRIRLF